MIINKDDKMENKLLKDVLRNVERRLQKGNVWMCTKAEGAVFQLHAITKKSIRVQRKYDRRGNPNKRKDYVPHCDFIDVWEDLNSGIYNFIGYGQKDLQNKQNRFSALIFALAGEVDYIEWRYVDDNGGRVKKDGAWKLFNCYVIAGDDEEERGIWYTYHALALQATRAAIKSDNKVLKVRPEKSDNKLECIQKKRPDSFSKPIMAIVQNIFVIEYRINRIAQIYDKWKETIQEYYNDQGKFEKKRPRKFKGFSLYMKLRNILGVLKISPTNKNKYHESVNKVKEWITLRNKIVHGDYKKLKVVEISSRDAVDCFDDVTEVLFQLNVALGYSSKEYAEKTIKMIRLKSSKSPFPSLIIVE